MDKSLEIVRKLGLNEYESKAYLALLRFRSAQASSISRHAAIPRARVYDVLSTLEKKGFVQRKPVKPVEYFALQPSEVFKKLEKEKKAELDSRLLELNEAIKRVEKELVSDTVSVATGEQVWLVEGRDNIYSRILQQLENCKETVIISGSNDSIKRKKAAFRQNLDALPKKGVKVKYRLLSPRSSARFMVFDRQAVMLFLSNDPASAGQEKAVLIQSPFVANFFSSAAKN